MVRKSRQRDWPGAPHEAWADATRRHGLRSLPRPNVPNWREPEVFTSRVLLPHATPSPTGTVAMGVFLVFLAWLKDFDGVLGVGLTVIAALLVAVGCYWMWWTRARRAHRVRRIHARALDHGVGGHAYRTVFAWNDGEGSPTPISLLIDETLPDFAASRLQFAVRTWLARVTTDRHLNSQACQALGHRWAVPAAEIFGPEAAGAWLIRDQGDDDSPWRLLIDRPDGPTEYFYDEVMVISGPPGRLHLDDV
ncbi:hypothetical protein AU186_17030 [Mycobacterium sp. GA-1999]|nr:hypothetical protein AU185_17335 [Mycobacterium sp. GA-0227b]KUH83835.1 hypothetical protein AU186_17030 [Mycobacterium sp. GA-1999]